MQTLLVALILLAATAYVGKRVWRTIASARAPRGAGCDSGCGCEPSVPQRTARH